MILFQLKCFLYLQQAINTMVMSQDGTYLAFGCVNGEMGIYHWQDMKLIDKYANLQFFFLSRLEFFFYFKGENYSFCDIFLSLLFYLNGLQVYSVKRFLDHM